MNRLRLQKLLKILIEKSDSDHQLKMNDLIALLEAEGIRAERKTIYTDLRFLEECGYAIRLEEGYYLEEAPFSAAEIKIITDSLNSLKNLDETVLNRLKDKLYSFLSVYRTKDLKRLEYPLRHKDRRFIRHLQDALKAISEDRLLNITRTIGRRENIAPVFLYRLNDYYYLYYHYPGSEKIYHVRFDNISDTALSTEKNDILFSRRRIIDHLNESSRAFHSGSSEILTFTIIEDSEYLRNRLEDDFPNIIFTAGGFSIRSSVSEAFFAQLAAYGDKIKADDPAVSETYCAYLEKIISGNRKPKNNK